MNYKAAHAKVNRLRGRPNKCEHCGTTDPNKKYEWASLNKNYSDPNDYIRLCVTCHKKLDGVSGVGLARYRKEKYESGKTKRRCRQCRTVFVARSDSHGFCSNSCYKLSKNSTRRRLYKPKFERSELKCAYRFCKRRFIKHQYRQKYCSYVCGNADTLLKRRERRCVV